MPHLLDGGSGNDILIGGSGHSILVGQDGNDQLFAAWRRSLLIGGRGADRLYGWNGSDLIVSGYTDFDSDREALDLIMREWTSDRGYYTRRRNLIGTGTGPRDNGNVFLIFNSSDPANDTVHDDEEVDKLWGGAGADWFILNRDGDGNGARDKVFGAKWYEVVDDLDRV